jgi:2'-5' RNA ligase
MKLAVVAYPKLDEADRVRIESFRTTHDPQAARLAAHFTFVFPVVADLIELEDEIALVAKSTPPISFTIRAARAVRDALTTESHVFLIPEEGSADITMLHDRLYSGVLRPHLRSDIRFVPHLTVAAVSSLEAAETLAKDLDAREVRGVIAALELIDVRGARVISITTFALRG